VLAFQIREILAFFRLHFLIFPRTIALLLFGALAWRTGVLESTAADRIRLKCRVFFGSAPRYRRPPDAVSRSPVTQAESSEARKTATRAISSGCPMRPRGVPPIISFSNSLPMMPAL
jgi:hypothetical protein